MNVDVQTTDAPCIQGVEKISVISVAELFGKAIKIIHEKESLDELFV